MTIIWAVPQKNQLQRMLYGDGIELVEEVPEKGDFWKDVGHFFEVLGIALAESTYLKFSYGLGIGGEVKVGPVDVNATALLAQVNMSSDFTLEYEETVETSLTLEAKIFKQASVGIDLEYSAPRGAALYQGLWGCDLAEFNGSLGVTVGEYDVAGVSFGAPSKDITLSYGFGFYLIFGMGVESSFNIIEFIEVWQSEW